jgi:hypothetical protein
MSLNEYDMVSLRRALPEHNLAAGAIGAIVLVYEHPGTYEVEFCDKEGVTIALVTLDEGELEKVT